jgi:putative beta-lysine N-acetyltransferase
MTGAVDRKTKLGRSVIQHGRLSDRIYLMELAREDMPGLLDELESLAREKSYSKIFAKVPEVFAEQFAARDYMTEAIVPGMFGGREAGIFMGRFLDPDRAMMTDPEVIREVLEVSEARAGNEDAHVPATGDYHLRKCTASDIEEMAEVYNEVFDSYPFPIDDPAYLAETMKENIVYYGAWHDANLVAISSAEMYPSQGNVEMTDFATREEHRRHQLAIRLLRMMEDEMIGRGITVAYTIARALSYGMNITFARMGYTFAGTLVNNTNIAGRIESMNVWYRALM